MCLVSQEKSSISLVHLLPFCPVVVPYLSNTIFFRKKLSMNDSDSNFHSGIPARPLLKCVLNTMLVIVEIPECYI